MSPAVVQGSRNTNSVRRAKDVLMAAGDVRLAVEEARKADTKNVRRRSTRTD